MRKLAEAIFIVTAIKVLILFYTLPWILRAIIIGIILAMICWAVYASGFFSPDYNYQGRDWT